MNIVASSEHPSSGSINNKWLAPILTDDTFNVGVAAVPSWALTAGLVVDGTADGCGGTFVPGAGIHTGAGETVTGQVGGAVTVVLADWHEAHCDGEEMLTSPQNK